MTKANLAYLGRRLLQAVAVLWASYTLTFVILHLLPSDPMETILQSRGQDDATAQEIAALAHQYGLDRPVLVQYVAMMLAALHGDLGVSYMQGESVSGLIASRLGMTLGVSLAAIVLAAVVAFSLAFLAAYTRHPAVRSLLEFVPNVTISVPIFWVGLLLMQVFSFSLGWLPAMGADGWQTMVLPVVTMSIPPAALLGRMLMNGFDEALASPFITAARAHGLGRGRLVLRHVVKNGSLPAFTVLGMIVGSTVTGAIVAETVFSRQGVGMLIQQSVQAQDIPVVQGCVLLAAAAFVVINLAVDMIYPIFDPRIVVRTAGKERS